MNKKNARKILFSVFFSLIFCFIVGFATAYAENGDLSNAQDPNNLLQRPPENSEVFNLPRGDLFAQVGKGVIKIIMAATGLILFTAVVASAITFILARGKEETITVAKNMLINSVLGFVIIAIGYALVFGISSLEFFGTFER